MGYATDNLNKKKMMLKAHSLSCGRVFIAIADIRKGGYVACFRLPHQDWVKAKSHV